MTVNTEVVLLNLRIIGPWFPEPTEAQINSCYTYQEKNFAKSTRFLASFQNLTDSN